MNYICKAFSLGFCIKDEESRFWYKRTKDEVSEETARQAIDLIPQMVAKAWLDKNVKMALRLDFGRGESLTKLPLLKKIYDYATNHNIFANPHLTTITTYTNGSSLNDEVFKWLEQIGGGLRHAISIVLVVESGKIDLGNIAKYKAYLTTNPCISTCLRYFLTDLDVDVLGDFEILSEFGFDRIYLHLTHLNEDLENVWLDTGKLVVLIEKVVDYYIEKKGIAWARGIYPLTEMHNFKSRDELWKDIDEEIKCSSYGGQLIDAFVMPDGSIYPCSKAYLLDDELKIGSVQDGISREKIDYAVKNMKIGCKCFMSDVCFRGCYILYRLMFQRGLVSMPRTDIHCLFHRAIYNKLKEYGVVK